MFLRSTTFDKCPRFSICFLFLKQFCNSLRKVAVTLIFVILKLCLKEKNLTNSRIGFSQPVLIKIAKSKLSTSFEGRLGRERRRIGRLWGRNVTAVCIEQIILHATSRSKLFIASPFFSFTSHFHIHPRDCLSIDFTQVTDRVSECIKYLVCTFRKIVTKINSAII